MTSTPRLVASSPVDLLAVSPVLLGFWPEDSVVMMTHGASRPFHARCPLPRLAEQSTAVLAEVERLLLAPLARHGFSAVLFIIYTPDARGARAALARLLRGCERRGVEVTHALWADGNRYVDLLDPEAAPSGRPYDGSEHPFVLEAMVAGRLRYRTRADLVASCEPDEAAVQAIVAALQAQGLAEDSGEVTAPPGHGLAMLVEGRWLEAATIRHTAEATTPTDAEAARMLWGMQCRRVRDAAWGQITREGAQAHVDLWSDLLRRAPLALAAAPAALMGWAAWQGGDGARAWVGVDRAGESDPDYVMATYLAAILTEALPPEFWTSDIDWSLGLH